MQSKAPLFSISITFISPLFFYAFFRWSLHCSNDERRKKRRIGILFIVKIHSRCNTFVDGECCFWNGATCARTTTSTAEKIWRFLSNNAMIPSKTNATSVHCVFACDVCSQHSGAHYPNTMRTANHVMDVCLWLDFSQFVSDCFCNCYYCCYHHRLLLWLVLLLLLLSLFSRLSFVFIVHLIVCL